MNTTDELKGLKILFATIPTDGHFNPLSGLAKYLQEAGCDVRWYTSVNLKRKLDRMNIPLYPFVQAREMNQDNFHHLFPERALIKDATGIMEYDLHYLLGDLAPEHFQDIQLIHQSFPFDLMISDCSFAAMPLVKNKLNVPVISIGIYPLPEQDEYLAPYSMGMPPAKNGMDMADYRKLHQEALNFVFKGSVDAFHNILKDHDIRIKKMLLLDLLVREASMHLQIGSPGFEYQRRNIGKNVRFIGSLLPYSAAGKTEPWYDERLERYQKIVLVTQGTIEKNPEKLLIPAMEAFSGTDTLLIVTAAGNLSAAQKAKYAADNIIIEDFIPYEDVMPHASVYITNGGYGGVLLSISDELPMVAAGLLEGKNEICARIGHFGIGIDLQTENPSAADLRRAVEEVISDGQYKKNISRLHHEMKNYNALELCAEYICELMRTTHTAVHLPVLPWLF